MLRNYLLITLRNLRRQKLYSTVNVAGLAIGMAGFALIMLFVRHELNYDRFHHGVDRIFRVVVEMRSDSFHGRMPIAPSAMSDALREQVPEVEAVSRVWQPQFVGMAKPVVRVGNDVYYEDHFFWADPELFEVLSFEFVHGDRKTALADPKAIVLSESTAQRYFGDLDPIGQPLNGGEHVVRAVVRDFPTNSHLRFDLLAAVSGTGVDEYPIVQRWLNHSYLTYLRVKEGAEAERIVEQINAIVQDQMGEIYKQMNQDISYELQPIVDVHLRSDFYSNIGSTSGDMAHVYAYSAVAMFLLLLAIINFTNLATAQSSERTVEVGVRKAVGAHRSQLARQFLGEAIILSFASMGVALIIMAVAAPWFSELTGMRIALNPRILLTMAGVALVTGLCAGFYPALQLSAFTPARALKEMIDRSGRSFGLRSILVVIQFTVSIGLLAATLIIGEQLDFLRSKSLGFDKEHLIVFTTRSDAIRRQFEPVRQDLLASPLVTAVGRCSQEPGYVENMSDIQTTGPEAETLEVTMLWVDYDFVDVMGMRVLEGRSFSREYADDPQHAFLVNETMARQLGQESAVGIQLGGPGDDNTATVVGVVADFHFGSLHRPIEPLLLAMPENAVNRNDSPTHAVLRLAPGDPQEGIEFIRQTLQSHNDPFPFDYHFVDERLDALYDSEEHMGRIFAIFSGLAVFLACLGLFGLTAFTVQQRTKEIGIRKVLGANSLSVVVLLSKEFTRLILLANLIAWPIVFFTADHWLQDFAYRIEPGVGLFIAGGLVALATAWLTASYHTMRAAHANPVDALRSE